MALDDYRIHFGGDMSAEKAEAVVDKWRAAFKFDPRNPAHPMIVTLGGQLPQS